VTSFIGCRHRRQSFPITIGAETYVVCHDCASRFIYDWNKMRAGKRSNPLANPRAFQ
jgi:hypothetical protein